MLANLFAIRGSHGVLAGSAGVAAATIFAVSVGAAQAATLRLNCVNQSSGTPWPIVVDLDRGLVDSQPAKITETRINWLDPKQGSYELDRATGKLKFSNASSTGGYYLYYVCRQE